MSPNLHAGATGEELTSVSPSPVAPELPERRIPRGANMFSRTLPKLRDLMVKITTPFDDENDQVNTRQVRRAKERAKK